MYNSLSADKGRTMLSNQTMQVIRNGLTQAHDALSILIDADYDLAGDLSAIDAALAELNGLAAQQRWEPEELAFAAGAATIGQIGDVLFVELYGETLQVDLPKNIRLCRRQGGER